MPRAMIFIDGTWLYISRGILSKEFREPNIDLDYGKIPKALGDILSDELGGQEIDVVRTYLFGNIAVNYVAEDREIAERRRYFYNMLKEEHQYETEIFTIDFQDRFRLSKKDRMTLGQDFDPKEKCVDIALATAMLYYAAIPYAYDIAVAVIGDRDFVPVLQHVRRLGKRTMIASIYGACAREYLDQYDRERVRDFDTVLLNEIIDRIIVRREKERYVCATCNKPFWDYVRLKAHQRPYCPECRAKYREQREIVCEEGEVEEA